MNNLNAFENLFPQLQENTVENNEKKVDKSESHSIVAFGNSSNKKNTVLSEKQNLSSMTSSRDQSNLVKKVDSPIPPVDFFSHQPSKDDQKVKVVQDNKNSKSSSKNNQIQFGGPQQPPREKIIVKKESRVIKEALAEPDEIIQFVKEQPQNKVSDTKIYQELEDEAQNQANGSKVIRGFVLGTTKLVIQRCKNAILDSRFKNGTEVIAYDKNNRPEFKLLLSKNELMLFKYLGSDLDVRLPSSVGNLPVKYIHKNFFQNGGLNPLNNITVKNVISNLDSDKVVDFDKDKVAEAKRGYKAVIFPKSITYLPSHLFENCYAIKEVVLPESLTNVDSTAFNFSGINDIYFNGPCPQGFLFSRLIHPVNVHYDEKYEQTFNVEVI